MAHVVDYAINLKNKTSETFGKVSNNFKKINQQAKEAAERLDKMPSTIDNLKYSLAMFEKSRLFSRSTKELMSENRAIANLKSKIKQLETLPTSSFIGRLKQAATAITGLRFRDMGVMLAINQMRRFTIESAKLYDKQAKADAQLKASLASNDYSSGRSFGDLKKQASGLQDKTLFSTDKINSVQSILLTFRNIKGEIYDKTIPAILDFATKLKEEPTETTQIFGKVLNDPVKGLKLLNSLGIKFSDSQKKNIKDLVAKGKLQEAQLIILTELYKKYGGSAEAAALAGLGPLEQLKNQWESLKAQIGEGIVNNLNKLVPALKSSVKWIQNNLSTVVALAKGIATATIAVISFKLAKLAFVKASVLYQTGTKISTLVTVLFKKGLIAATVAFRALNVAMKANIFGLIIAGVIAAVAAFKMFRSKVKDNKKIMKEASEVAGEYYAKEKKHLDDIFVALRKTNPYSKERNKLVDELKRIMPGMNSELEKQLRTTNKLNESQATAIELLKQQAIAEGLKDSLKKQTAKVAEATIAAELEKRENKEAEEYNKKTQYQAQASYTTSIPTAGYLTRMRTSNKRQKALKEEEKTLKNIQDILASKEFKDMVFPEAPEGLKTDDYGSGDGVDDGTSGSKRGGKGMIVNIHNLIAGGITIQSTSLKEGAEQIKRIVIEALMDATNEFAARY